MSDRWLIIKNGDVVGPLTAEQIRASLRDGTFDPFDLVMREGSSVRRELVEVDELFQSSQVTYDARAQELTNAVERRAEDQDHRATELVAGQGQLVLADKRQQFEKGGFTVAVQPAANAKGARPGNALASARAAQRRPRRRDPKHFHLMDGKGRVMGPMTAGEIQALYYKGVLDKSVKVMRDGSGAKVPVGKFVMVYAENQSGARPAQGAHPNVGGPLSPSGAQRAMLARQLGRPPVGQASSSMSPLAVVAIVVALVLGGFAAWIFYKSAHPVDLTARPPAKTQTQKPKATPKADKSGGKLKRGPLVPGTTEAEKRRAAADERAKQRAALVAAAQEEAEALRAADAKRAAEQKAAADRARAKAQKKAKTKAEKRREARDKAKKEKREAAERARKAAWDREQQRRASLARTQPKPPVQPASLPPPGPAPPPAGGGVGGLTDGQNVSGLGPMTFDKNAVQNCEGTCTVTFNGAGGTVRVAFFKQVWGQALLQRSGGVYVSGLVRKNGGSTKIILSNVK